MKTRHCGLTLTARGSQTYRPMILTYDVKYQGVRINLKSTFMHFTVYPFKCPGTCNGYFEAWQGHQFDGGKSKLQQIMPSEQALWASIIASSEKVDETTDICAVQGSQRVFPFRFKGMIPLEV